MRAALTNRPTAIPVKVHLRGTYVCMEGPQFSSRRERDAPAVGGDLIGMTLMPEAKLAARPRSATLRGSLDRL